MAKGFVILCIAFVLGLAKAATFNDCGSTTGKFTKVTVSGCTDADVDCILVRNSQANITIDFESSVQSSSLKTVVHGHVLGMDMPFPLSNPDACQSGIQCPITSGQSYEYQASLPVLKSYPKIKVMVKWQLQDDNGKDVVCVQIPAKIK